MPLYNKIKSQKKKIIFTEYTVEDTVIAGFFYQFKDDPELLEAKIHQALRLGVLALEDNRLQTILKQIEKELPVQLKGLQEMISIVRDEAPVARGARFEADTLMSLLNKLSKHFDDYVESLGGKTGLLQGSKVGDLVVTVNPKDTSGVTRKIVFEAKTKNMSVPSMLEELESARLNREASFAVIVFDEEHVPNEVGMFRHYPGHGIACAINSETMDYLPLEVAYKLARYHCIGNIKSGEVRVDARKISDIFKRIESEMKTISDVKSKLTSSKNAIDGASDLLSQFQSRIKATLDEIELCLREDESD